jgi:sialate O-acetylesterase
MIPEIHIHYRLSRIIMKRLGSAILLLIVLTTSLSAEVKLPKVFADHMVLQRGQDVAIWGWADPGEAVEISTPFEVQKIKAGDDGKWMTRLKPMKAGGPIELKLKGSNEIVLKDVLVGDVWVCSGQSNMEWSVAASTNSQEEIANANHPNIRLFDVKKTPKIDPTEDVELDAPWLACTPESIPRFSAVAYFFGRKLHQEIDVPIGLISTNWGGTRIEPWTPPVGFEAVEAVKNIPQSINREEFNHGTPTTLYNGMVHGLVPFGIKGAIWYQGESNRNDGMLYYEKMKALIAGWRSVFQQPDLPFYYVQLAPYIYGNSDPEILAKLWESQVATLAVPHTGMAVTTDIANLKDIHPKNKQDVGLRLALWALAKDYGKEIVYSGPLYKSMKVEGNKVRLFFEHAKGLKSSDEKPLSWFTIAGEDGKFVDATAMIDGDTIVVSSPDVGQPKVVRFGWHQEAEPNLVNGAGLPASPFRTDGPLAGN